MYNVQDIAFFIIKLFAWLYASVDMLITVKSTCMTTSFHYEGDWIRKTSLTPPLFIIAISACIKPGKCAVMYLCVRGYWFCLFLWFWHFILELFRQCGIFCFLFDLYHTVADKFATYAVFDLYHTVAGKFVTYAVLYLYHTVADTFVTYAVFCTCILIKPST